MESTKVNEPLVRVLTEKRIIAKTVLHFFGYSHIAMILMNRLCKRTNKYLDELKDTVPTFFNSFKMQKTITDSEIEVLIGCGILCHNTSRFIDFTIELKEISEIALELLFKIDNPEFIKQINIKVNIADLRNKLDLINSLRNVYSDFSLVDVKINLYSKHLGYKWLLNRYAQQKIKCLCEIQGIDIKYDFSSIPDCTSVADIINSPDCNQEEEPTFSTQNLKFDCLKIEQDNFSRNHIDKMLSSIAQKEWIFQKIEIVSEFFENIYFYLLLVNRQLDWLSRIKSRNPSVSVCHVAWEFLIFENNKRPLIHQWMKIGCCKLAAAGEDREAEWVQAINVEIDVDQVICVEQKEVGIWEVKVTGKVYVCEVQSIDGATVKLEDEEICMTLNSKSKVLYAIDKINVFQLPDSILNTFEISIPDYRFYLECCRIFFKGIPKATKTVIKLYSSETYDKRTCICTDSTGSTVSSLIEMKEIIHKKVESIFCERVLNFSENDIASVIKIIIKSECLLSLNLVLYEHNFYEELISAINKNSSIQKVNITLFINDEDLDNFILKTKNLCYLSFQKQFKIMFQNKRDLES